MKIRKIFAPYSRWGILCPYNMEPTSITVHNTYNDASAYNEALNVINNSGGTSFHWAVDNKEAINLIPEHRNTWHAGDGVNGRGNRTSISIEICYSKSGGELFNASERNGAKLVAKILRERGWSITRVRTHQSWSGKYCPHRTLDRGWQRFLNMVQKELTQSNKTSDIVGQRPWDGKSILWKHRAGYRLTEWEKGIFNLANQTIAGKYGNGGTRRIRLGSNYNCVQAEINKRSREGLL